MDMREMIVQWHLRLATLVFLLGLVSPITNVDASYAGADAEGIGDTCTSLPQDGDELVPVDWATLTIIADADEDDEANAIADEEEVYQAMGFKSN